MATLFRYSRYWAGAEQLLLPAAETPGFVEGDRPSFDLDAIKHVCRQRLFHFVRKDSCF